MAPDLARPASPVLGASTVPIGPAQTPTSEEVTALTAFDPGEDADLEVDAAELEVSVLTGEPSLSEIEESVAGHLAESAAGQDDFADLADVVDQALPDDLGHWLDEQANLQQAELADDLEPLVSTTP